MSHCRCLDLTLAEWKTGDDAICPRCGREVLYDRYDRKQGWNHTHHLARSICAKAGISRRDAEKHPEIQDKIDRLYPCQRCHKSGPREYAWFCDDCVAESRAKQAETEGRLVLSGSRLGKYQPDGLGCVEKVSLVERAFLNGANPYV